MKKRIISMFLVICSLIAIVFLPCNNKTVCAEQNDYKLNSYVLMDFNTGKLLLENNSTEHYEVASMVKLMTTLITLENIESGKLQLDDRLIASSYAASMEGSQAFLNSGEEYKLEDLIKSIIIASANDSSVVVAEHIAGSEQGFVRMMNDKAEKLGMENTLYANSTGLPSTNQYSSAKDTAILLKEVAKHELYYNYSKVWMDELIHKDGRKTELVNTNRLIRNYNGCDIGKTGYTDEAGYCLATSAKRGDMRLISVVMGADSSKDRFDYSSNILNYGFTNFENKLIQAKDTLINNDIKLKKCLNTKMDLVLEKDCYALTKRGEESNIEIKFKLPSTLKAPISKGDNIGTAYIVEDGIVIEEMNVISNENYDKATYFTTVKQIFNNW